MHHYTNKAGYNAIRSQTSWTFRASKPPGKNPRGAYFTSLDPDHPKLAQKLRIPKQKIEYVFCFVDNMDLQPHRGGRGTFIFFHPDDYGVPPERQTRHGNSRTTP